MWNYEVFKQFTLKPANSPAPQQSLAHRSRSTRAPVSTPREVFRRWPRFRPTARRPPAIQQDAVFSGRATTRGRRRTALSRRRVPRRSRASADRTGLHAPPGRALDETRHDPAFIQTTQHPEKCAPRRRCIPGAADDPRPRRGGARIPEPQTIRARRHGVAATPETIHVAASQRFLGARGRSTCSPRRRRDPGVVLAAASTRSPLCRCARRRSPGRSRR